MHTETEKRAARLVTTAYRQETQLCGRTNLELIISKVLIRREVSSSGVGPKMRDVSDLDGMVVLLT